MIFTAAEAAKAVGKSTSTITRAIESHKISASKDENGSWKIDAAELYRVFAPAKAEAQSVESDAKPNAKGALQAELDVMAEKLRSAEALNARLQGEVSDLRTDRDAWRKQAERQTLLLQDHRDKEIKTAADNNRTGWLGRLFGSKNAAS